jgi:hypothetical protein
LLKRQIEDWTFMNWTSKLRLEAGHPRFTEKERDFSDFTYLDSSEYMRNALQAAGANLPAHWSRSTTYHLEVKTTLEDCAEPFFASQNQLDKVRERGISCLSIVVAAIFCSRLIFLQMRRFDLDPDNAYILLRVFEIESEQPGLRLFPSPWGLYMDRTLEFRSEMGYKVYQKDNTE